MSLSGAVHLTASTPFWHSSIARVVLLEHWLHRTRFDPPPVRDNASTADPPVMFVRQSTTHWPDPGAVPRRFVAVAVSHRALTAPHIRCAWQTPSCTRRRGQKPSLTSNKVTSDRRCKW